MHALRCGKEQQVLQPVDVVGPVSHSRDQLAGLQLPADAVVMLQQRPRQLPADLPQLDDHQDCHA